MSQASTQSAEELLATAIHYLKESAAYRYTNVAFLMLLVWDHVITLDREVASIWKLPWRLPKYLFLINRYIVPPLLIFNGAHTSIYNLPPAFCEFVGKWTSWITPLLALATVQLLLVLRVHVICHSQAITVFVGAIFIASTISFAVVAIMVSRILVAGSQPDYPGCIFIPPSYIWAGWVPPVTFEMVVVFVTVYKLIQYRQTSMLYIVTRDSLVYFTVMVSSLLGNLLLNRLQKGYFSAILVLPSSVIACIAVARMTMNVRQFADTEEFSLGDVDITTVDLYMSRRSTTADPRPSRSYWGWSTAGK